MQTNFFKKEKGFTLVELLVYMSGLLILGSVLILMIVQFYGLYKEIIVVPRADRVGLILVDRITKDIRGADSIDVFESQFGTTNGVLKLTERVNESIVTKTFSVENGRVQYQEDSSSPVPLSSNDFTVSNFNFTFVQTGISQAIRFNLELQFDSAEGLDTRTYTGFAILRESYE